MNTHFITKEQLIAMLEARRHRFETTVYPNPTDKVIAQAKAEAYKDSIRMAKELPDDSSACQ